MPDWTYQTVFRPLLFRLPPAFARNLALGSLGRLARLLGGTHVIEFMGHMRTDSRLAFEHGTLNTATQIGLSCRLDPQQIATPGLAKFGFGLLEIGPIVAEPTTAAGAVAINSAEERIELTAPAQAIGLNEAAQKLEHRGPNDQPILARLEPASAEQAAAMIVRLQGLVSAFVVPLKQWYTLEPQVRGTTAKPLLLALSSAQWNEEAHRLTCLSSIERGEAQGLVLEAHVGVNGSVMLGRSEYEASLRAIGEIRSKIGAEPMVISSVGIHSPADALDALDAGANWVMLDSGIVFAGPGLPKRINESLLYAHLQCEAKPPAETPLGGQAWLWAWLMGLAMFVGGVLAMVIATTRVVLPYDESMAGLTRDQLVEINDRLLAFMRHDRVTLAGTMLSVGILYLTLACHGIRRGVHWAWVAVIVSALAGFVSFFSFLGFGYFDPFHAFVTAILFQFLLLTVHSCLPLRHAMEPPDLHNTWKWKLNQWGQLSFVVHGAILIVAGCVISVVGMTTVFVQEDLEFMDTCIATLLEAHPRLIPLVAHDRATFGGMLVATGVATLLPALWGFRRGQAWLWWALMSAGNIAYVATIAVHWTVGYLSLEHLLPAYGGLLLLWVGGALSYPYLAGRSTELEREWSARLS